MCALSASWTVQAQSSLHGRVASAEGTRTPISAAHVQAMRLGLSAVTDSLGRFRLTGIPSGEYILTFRAAGFEPDSILVEFGEDESVSKDFFLRPRVTRLAEIEVSAAADRIVSAKLVGFAERKRIGIGRHLDRAAIARWENHRTSDLMATVPGVDVVAGKSSKAWASGGRAVSPGKCAMCVERIDEVLDREDINAGARMACYMDVYLDGALVYNSASRLAPLFDLNSIQVSSIEAIEVYASASQMPAEFNRTGGGCGVVLIWTR